MIWFLVFCVIGIFVQGYVIVNLLKKIEFYEETIESFYERLSITIHTMRAIDDKQMFEKDDEVGEVFSNLSDIIKQLYDLLYEDD